MAKLQKRRPPPTNLKPPKDFKKICSEAFHVFLKPNPQETSHKTRPGAVLAHDVDQSPSSGVNKWAHRLKTPLSTAVKKVNDKFIHPRAKHNKVLTSEKANLPTTCEAITTLQKPPSICSEPCHNLQEPSNALFSGAEDDFPALNSFNRRDESEAAICVTPQERTELSQETGDSSQEVDSRERPNSDSNPAPGTSATTMYPSDDSSYADSIGDNLNNLEASNGPVREIPQGDITREAISIHSKNIGLPSEGIDARLVCIKNGTRHRVFVVKYSTGSTICLRVPAQGLQDTEWSTKDADCLQSTALCMRYISESTNLPMPKPVWYDTTKKNFIKALYIALTHIRGRSLKHLWWEKDGYLPLEERRQAILKSLASHMANLRRFPFSRAGHMYSKPENAEPFICSALWKPIETEEDAPSKFTDPADSPGFASSDAMFLHKLDEYSETQERYFKDEADDDEDEDNESLELLQHARGTIKLYKLLVDNLPHAKLDNSSAAQFPGDFFVSPPENDLQNVLADESGQITGFIDWDSIEVLPSYLSWATLPLWLCTDWRPSYAWPSEHGPSSPPREIECYRKQYARYLREACNGIDDSATEFTEKTAMFQAVHQNLAESNHEEFAHKFAELLVPRIESWKQLERVGSGWAEGEEEYMKNEVKALFAPPIAA